MSDIYSVEVFKSSVSGQEAWVNDYDSKEEALEFYNQSKKREALRGKETPSKYYKTHYLGKKTNINGVDVYEEKRVFNMYG